MREHTLILTADPYPPEGAASAANPPEGGLDPADTPASTWAHVAVDTGGDKPRFAGFVDLADYPEIEHACRQQEPDSTGLRRLRVTTPGQIADTLLAAVS